MALPHHNPPPDSPGRIRASDRSRAGRATVWVILAVVALVFITGCGFGLLRVLRLSAGNAAANGASSTPEPRMPDCEFTITHGSPPVAGQPFEILFTVHNPTTETRTLASIDLGTPLPGQLVHTKTDPVPTFIDESDDLVQLWFNRPIFAGDSRTVTSTIIVPDPGSLEVTLTFWFPETLAAEFVHTIEVGE